MSIKAKHEHFRVVLRNLVWVEWLVWFPLDGQSAVTRHRAPYANPGNHRLSLMHLMKNAILYLVKFFDKEEYADQFVRGRLRLNRLGYYKRMERSREDGRGDYAEAPAAWWQKHDFNIEWNDHPELNIRPENLAGPVLLSFDNYNHLSIFCMTAIHTGEFELECESGLILLAEGDEDKLRQQFRIDAKCFEMGQFAVVVRGGDFVLRAKNAIASRDYTYSSTLVDYFDPAVFHGTFSLQEMAFKKRNVFSYQNEYRICVDTHTKNDGVVWIEIGDISDFAAKMRAADVNTYYQLHFRKA
jgi:hypothetical protein